MKIKILIYFLLFSIFSIPCKKLPTTPTLEEILETNPPYVYYFTASPDSIRYLEFSTLSWEVTNATEVKIDNGIGIVGSIGSIEVDPKTTIKYVLIATNSIGSTEQSCTIIVIPSGHVIMISGPIWEKFICAETNMRCSGRVKNVGNLEAKEIGIILLLYDKNGNLLLHFDEQEHISIEYSLLPDESSYWKAWIDDPDCYVRKRIDISKTEYEIYWN